MGWTLQTKGENINWAGFASETNVGQRRTFAQRLKMWLTRLAEVQNLPFAEVAKDEPLSKYLDVRDEKKPCIQLFQPRQEDKEEVPDLKVQQETTRPPTLSDAQQAQRYSLFFLRMPSLML